MYLGSPSVSRYFPARCGQGVHRELSNPIHWTAGLQSSSSWPSMKSAIGDGLGTSRGRTSNRGSTKSNPTSRADRPLGLLSPLANLSRVGPPRRPHRRLAGAAICCFSILAVSDAGVLQVRECAPPAPGAAVPAPQCGWSACSSPPPAPRSRRPAPPGGRFSSWVAETFSIAMAS